MSKDVENASNINHIRANHLSALSARPMCFDPKTFNPNGARQDTPVAGPSGRGYQLYVQEQQALGQSPMSAQEWQAAKQRGEV